MHLDCRCLSCDLYPTLRALNEVAAYLNIQKRLSLLQILKLKFFFPPPRTKFTKFDLFCSFHHHHHLYMPNTARSLFGLFFNMNMRTKKTVIDRMTAEVIADVIKFHKSSKRKCQCQASSALHSHRLEVYASFSAINSTVKHMTTMMKTSSLYTVIWAVYYDDKRIMNRIMILSNFDYHDINAHFIQKSNNHRKDRGTQYFDTFSLCHC